jgi:hypothetical protein
MPLPAIVVMSPSGESFPTRKFSESSLNFVEVLRSRNSILSRQARNHLEVSRATMGGIAGHCAILRIALLYSLISDGTQNCSSNSPVVPNAGN